ncbi:ATP-binding protein [Sphaerisporangium corydalis]|uniref:ATP-binding protein n=1 Tax=Sphaerisporangium corydalis TaxID=1441875 RepID=A0ABV9EKC5_9ACTN|nr:ATP-binding protein [Sphaerisporangium corydalis]
MKQFEATPRVVGQVRGFIGAALADWDLQEMADDARLYATELVTNVILHSAPQADGSKTVDVLIDRRRSGEVTIMIRDMDARLPVPQLTTPAPHQESGRGLHLVSALADSLWVRSTPTGKTIGCRFDLQRYGVTS